MPRMPPSRMSRFEPPPRINSGIACSVAMVRRCRKLSSVSRRIRASAGPPMRNEVKGANGRANSLRPGTSRSRVGRSHGVERDGAISHSPCGVYKCLANLPDIPGTEGQEDVVGAHIALQEGHDRGPLLQVVHLTLAMTDQARIEQRRGHPGQWRFA